MARGYEVTQSVLMSDVSYAFVDNTAALGHMIEVGSGDRFGLQKYV